MKAHAIVLTNCVGFGPALFRALNFGNSPNDSSLTRPVFKKIAIFSLDVAALIMQLSGALAWPILQWTDNSTQEYQLMSAWALPIGKSNEMIENIIRDLKTSYEPFYYYSNSYSIFL